MLLFQFKIQIIKSKNYKFLKKKNTLLKQNIRLQDQEKVQMFLIKDKYSKDGTNIVFTQRNILTSILINLYLITFALIDVIYLKIASVNQGSFSFIELYIFMTYFIAIQCYSWYNCYKKYKQKLKEVSYINTFVWHFILLINSLIAGLASSSTNLSIRPFYFTLRLTLYGYSLFVIINNMRLIVDTVLRKNQLKKFVFQYLNWQLNNFYLIYYASVIGISFDLISFGNNIQYNVWLGYISSLILYEFINIMNKINGWIFFKIIFSSQ